MKFFNNKTAITLIELITTIAISGILFLIIFVFITDSVEELVDNDVKIGSIDEGFTFKDTIGRFVRGGYSNVIVFSGITDPGYVGDPNPNNVLYLKNVDGTKGILIGIVNIEDDLNLIQRNYTYGDNFLGYRYLSIDEMAQIDADTNKIYEKKFTNDKIFQNIRMRDFRVKTYNGDRLIDVYFSVINLFDDSLFGKNFNDFFVDKLIIDEYNLIY